jgi:hypothetical protein
MTKNLLAVVAATILALPSIADAQCPVPGFQYAAFGDLTMDVTGGGSVRSYDSGSGSFIPVCGTDADLATNSIASAAIKVSGGRDVCGEVQFGIGGVGGRSAHRCQLIAGLGAHTRPRAWHKPQHGLASVVLPTKPERRA